MSQFSHEDLETSATVAAKPEYLILGATSHLNIISVRIVETKWENKQMTESQEGKLNFCNEMIIKIFKERKRSISDDD